jgi:hypothetical protein
MRANANHFRDYPDAFPYESVRAHTQMEKGDLCQYFGLTFPHNGPLECRGDQNWNAAQCAKLGLNFNDLVDFGLRYVEQYSDLIVHMTPQQAKHAEMAMGVTPERIAELICLKDQVESQQEDVSMHQKEQVAAVLKANTPVYVPFVQQKQQQPETVYYKPQPRQLPTTTTPSVPIQLVHQPRRIARVQQQQQQQQQQQPITNAEDLPKMSYSKHGARAAARHGAVFLK